MKSHSLHSHRRGFTLMELLVVISIMVVLAGFTIGAMGFVNQKQAREKAKVQIGLLQVALQDYYSDHGEFPANATASGNAGTRKITAVLFPDDPEGKVYLPEIDPENDSQAWTKLVGKNITLLDPWGKEYLYRTNNPDPKVAPYAVNPDFDLWSAGPDGLTTVGRGKYDPEAKNNRDDIRGW